MAPPKPIKCPAPGCKYKTPKGCPTWDLMYKDRDDHMNYCHPKPTTNHSEPTPHTGACQRSQTRPKPSKQVNVTPTVQSETIFNSLILNTTKAINSVHVKPQTSTGKIKEISTRSSSPMNSTLRNLAILPMENPDSTDTEEQDVDKFVENEGWNKLQFTAIATKSEGVWRCSEGCVSIQNKDFWSQKQAVIKHIAKFHPDPRISFFVCKLCKTYTNVSCYQVLEHLRLKHRINTFGGEKMVEDKLDSILACLEKAQSSHRVKKKSRERWYIDLSSNIDLQKQTPPTEATTSSLPLLQNAVALDHQYDTPWQDPFITTHKEANETVRIQINQPKIRHSLLSNEPSPSKLIGATPELPMSTIAAETSDSSEQILMHSQDSGSERASFLHDLATPCLSTSSNSKVHNLLYL